MSKTELTRHEIREKALQALFPLDFNADLTKQDAIDYALAYDNREIVSEDGEDLVPPRHCGITQKPGKKRQSMLRTCLETGYRVPTWVLLLQWDKL